MSETTGTDELLFARDGAIATITFNHPHARNAMTWAMYEGLYATCEKVDADEKVRVLVLRGAGGKAFVAGTDITQFRSSGGQRTGSRARSGWTASSAGSRPCGSPPWPLSRATPEQALGAGLASEVIAPGQLDDRVRELTEQLCRHAPLTNAGHQGGRAPAARGEPP
jgi:enoyl-CoA hydratase/carnithine racemase